MTAAARVPSGKEVRTYYGDTREPEHVDVRTLADEVRRVVRTKLLNPKWIEGQFTELEINTLKKIGMAEAIL